jgi:serine phosphatase RsbU (regulator of sigma subunit)
MPTEADHFDLSDRLRSLEAVTGSELAHLSADELLNELLDRVHDLLGTDTAAVLLLDPSRRHLVATAARGISEEVHQGVRIPVGQGFAGRIAEQRSPLAIDRVAPDTVLNPILWEKGIRSLLGAPLMAGGEVLGVLHVGTWSSRSFTEEDAVLLQLVADRVSLAVQARMHQAERAAATTLQRSLLPEHLPSVPGLELASRYVAGDANGVVGGDWYDVFTLPSGALFAAVGDVVGNGLEAAQSMGRIRSVLRAYALDVEDPAELMAKLDRQVHYFRPGMSATAWCGVLDRDRRTLRMSSAGHPPPALAEPGHPARILDVPPDAPIGLGSAAGRRTTRMELVEGALLCAYTDGLIERRGVPLDDGLERLRRAVSANPAETVCATVMAELIGSDVPMDDIAVLVLHRLPAHHD